MRHCFSALARGSTERPGRRVAVRCRCQRVPARSNLQLRMRRVRTGVAQTHAAACRSQHRAVCRHRRARGWRFLRSKLQDPQLAGRIRVLVSGLPHPPDLPTSKELALPFEDGQLQPAWLSADDRSSNTVKLPPDDRSRLDLAAPPVGG
jgi:hypothetical protein